MTQTISSFHDVTFPINVAFGSSGGPERSTEIVRLGSGREKRNQRWSRSRRRYDAGYGVENLDSLHEVVEFYEARRGPLYGFRFRDPMDWKSCAPLQDPRASDQLIGTGNGTSSTFQLLKTYGQEFDAYERVIEKPREGSVIVMVDGEVISDGAGFTVDTNTGQVTFSAENIPTMGASITAGFEFDVPVRFEMDNLTINLTAFSAGEVPTISLLEIRP